MSSTPIQFRMDADTKLYLTAIASAHKLTYAAVVRLAVLRMAREEFGTMPGDRSKPNIPAEYRKPPPRPRDRKPRTPQVKGK